MKFTQPKLAQIEAGHGLPRSLQLFFSGVSKRLSRLSWRNAPSA